MAKEQGSLAFRHRFHGMGEPMLLRANAFLPPSSHDMTETNTRMQKVAVAR